MLYYYTCIYYYIDARKSVAYHLNKILPDWIFQSTYIGCGRHDGTVGKKVVPCTKVSEKSRIFFVEKVDFENLLK